jgi:hypothetical protein
MFGGVADAGLAASQASAAGVGMSVVLFAALLARYLSRGSSRFSPVVSADDWAEMSSASGDLFPLLCEFAAEVVSTTLSTQARFSSVLVCSNCHSVLQSLAIEVTE